MSRYEYLLVKTALLYLVLTGVFGVAFLFAPSLAAYFRVTHIHLGVIGFFLSMVMGVAYWMMPRPGQLKQEGMEALTFYLLNAGLVLRVVAEPWWRYSRDPLPHWLSIGSGLLLLAAIVSFAVAMQARVKTREMILESRLRREEGNRRSATEA